MRSAVVLLAMLSCCLSLSVQAEQRFVVQRNFVNVHTGPGGGFPVFYSLENGEEVELELRQGDWLRVSSGQFDEGWMHLAGLARGKLSGGKLAKPSLNFAALYGFVSSDSLYGVKSSLRVTERASLGVTLLRSAGRFNTLSGLMIDSAMKLMRKGRFFLEPGVSLGWLSYRAEANLYEENKEARLSGAMGLSAMYRIAPLFSSGLAVQYLSTLGGTYDGAVVALVLSADIR